MPTTVPQREALFWARAYKKSASPLYEWMDGWLTGWALNPRLAGWLAGCYCLPTEQACKGTGAGLGNARHGRGTKPATVPR